MEPEDIIDVYKQEINFANHKIEEAKKVYTKQLYANRTETYWFSPIEYKRKSGINVVIQCFDNPQKSHKERLGIWLYIWCNYRNGMIFIRPLIDPRYGPLIWVYTSHFIDRYRERMLGDTNMSKKDAFSIFLRNNTKRGAKQIPSEKHPENGWIFMNQGVGFVNITQKIISL